MRIGEVARAAGVTPKAVRYYESLGLVSPMREPNGYRDYSEHDVRVVSEIKLLMSVGISPSRAQPFVDCLASGHVHGDDCPASLAVYRDGIAGIDAAIAELSSQRAKLQRLLDGGANRHERTSMASDYTTIPDDLPIPTDDGAAEHLPGRRLPAITLPASDGTPVDLGRLPAGRSIVYFYPLTGVPGVDLPEGWDAIPGARGCSTEACDFRDHFDDLRSLGVVSVYGASSQDPGYQDEVVQRLRLPFTMISDEGFELAAGLDLPTFSAEGHPRLYTRLTLVVLDGVIEHVFYPIFPPNTHAQQVLDWLRAHPEGVRSA